MLSHDGADRKQHDETWTMRKATSLTSPVVFDLVSLAAIVLPVTCTSLGLRPRWLLKRIVPHDCRRIHHAFPTKKRRRWETIGNSSYSLTTTRSCHDNLQKKLPRQLAETSGAATPGFLAFRPLRAEMRPTLI